MLLPTLQAKFDLSATTLAVLVAGQLATISITQPFLGASPTGSAAAHWPSVASCSTPPR